MKIILFFANFEKKTNFFEKLRDNRSVQLTIKKTNILQQIDKNIMKIYEKSRNYQSKKRKIIS